ncbi:aspartate-semialdehyde dehydrogenase [Candidatus Vidania fulgoroideorum]
MNIGIFGHRGLVGRTLIKRLVDKKINIKNKFYLLKKKNIFNFFKTENLYKCCDLIISCKNSNFAKKKKKTILSWKGIWVDASSYFRDKDYSTIILDPINKKDIINSLKKKKRIFSGGNCTVSLLLMAIRGILNRLKIKYIYCNTYQAISGAGYQSFKELLFQTKFIVNKSLDLLTSNNFRNLLKTKSFPKKTLGKNLAFSLCPWIDDDNNTGDSKEEIKTNYEINKILKTKNIKIFSTCVRVNCLRSHSESLIIKLFKDISLKRFIYFLKKKYVKIIKNKKNETENLNPVQAQETINILIGRIRKIKKRTFSLFLVGDQLLWGAVEPIIRFIKILNNVC